MFVQMGMTDDSYTIPNSETLSYRDFVNSFLPYSPTDSVELKMRYALKIDQDDLMWYKLLELDLFNGDKKIGIKNATPAQALQKILMDKWTLKPDDKDMIVMYHKFGYELNGKKKQIDSNMVLVGGRSNLYRHGKNCWPSCCNGRLANSQQRNNHSRCTNPNYKGSIRTYSKRTRRIRSYL